MILLFLLLNLSQWAAATNESLVLIKSPLITEADFSAELSTRPEVISFSQKQLNDWKISLPTKTEKDFAQAQEAFLNKDTVEAEQIFKSFSHQLRMKNLGPMERKALHYYYMRISQLTQDNNLQQEYLLKARDFAPDLQPSQSLFPPPLIDEFYKISKKHPTTLESLEKNFPGARWLVLNGQLLEVKPGAQIKIGAQPIQIFVFSDDRASFKFEGDFHQAATVFQQQELLVKNCDLKPTAQELNFPFEIYFGEACPQNKRPLQLNPELIATETLPQLAPEPMPAWKNKWLWISIGAIISGYVVYQNSEQKNKEIIPTTTEGFF